MGYREASAWGVVQGKRWKLRARAEGRSSHTDCHCSHRVPACVIEVRQAWGVSAGSGLLWDSGWSYCVDWHGVLAMLGTARNV